ncbi:MAG: A24 family peptidase [Alphaproteobacteria bacterium]
MTIELLFVILCGLALGSFVTLATHRLPLGEDIVVKPSQCPSCKTKLGFKDLWPVLSWVISGGTCRHCKNPIGVRYPLIELATLGVTLLVYARFGLTFPGICVALMGVMLLIMIIVDLKHYIIPDMVHIVLLPLGLAFHASMGTDWNSVLLGFLAGVALGLALHHGYRFLRKTEGLGYGDVKFFAVAGLWITVDAFVPFMFYSGVFGVLFGLLWRMAGQGKIFPFGPALAVAMFGAVLYPQYYNLLIIQQEIANIYNNNM